MPRSRRRLITLAFFSVALGVVFTARTQSADVDRLIRRWAPLLWLAPDEKYLPTSVEEFLQHVYPADVNGRSVSEDLPLGEASLSTYLITKQNLDSLKNKSSFLHGRDPQKAPIPIYVTVTNCEAQSFHLTYWMFYPYNEGKEICFIGKFPAPLIFNTCLGKIKTLGNHVGDFEHVSISFKSNEPDELFLSVHETGVYYRYDRRAELFKFNRQSPTKSVISRIRFPPIVRLFKGRPVLFVARGSHGLWAGPGKHLYFRVPKLYDKNGYGTPWRSWENLRVYRRDVDESPGWMEYFGRWGNPKTDCFLYKKLGICELSDGPSGILTKKHDFRC